MFKSFFFAVMVLLSVQSYAQEFSISGNVRDGKTNQALPGATVQLEGARRYAVTDDFGRFHLEKIQPGEYTVRVKFLGYAEKTEQLAVAQNEVLNITLQESAKVTDEVVVFATRAGDKTPTTFTNVSQPAIQKQNFGQDLPFLLNWTPSAVTTSDAGTGVGYTGIRIRGSDAASINVTINGIPYNDSESLGTFWVDIPDIASSSQSIQVQRGVGTSTNGAGAFGATINLQTLTRNDQPHADVVNSFGSFNTRRHTLNFGSGLLNDHWIVEGRLSKISSDGFIDRTTADLNSYYFSAGFYSGNTIIKGIMFGGKERTYQAWYGVPESRLKNDVEAMQITAINEGWNQQQTQNLLNSDSRTFNPYTYKNQVDNYQQDHYQLHFSQRFTEAFTTNLSLHYTPGKGYYEEYRYRERFSNYGLTPVVIGDSTITRTDLIRRRWLDNHFYGFTYALSYLQNHWDVTFGGGWNRYDGDHFGEIIWAQVSPVPIEHQYYFNNGDKRDFNSFIKINYELAPRLHGFVDLQYRKILYEAAGIENRGNPVAIDVDFNFFNPKVGLVYTLPDNQQLYASYSIANREPVRRDFINAPTGENPKHETLRNVEAGYRISQGDFILSANYYLMYYKNQLVHTGKLNDVGAAIRTNVDDSYRTGVELEALLKLTDQLVWNANATLSRNKVKRFTEQLYDYGVDFDEYNEVVRSHRRTDISFSPNVIVGSSLSYRPIPGFEATWLAKYVGAQYLDNTSDPNRKLDAYFVNDLRLTYTLRPSFAKEIGLSLLVNNLFSEVYESNGYTWGFLGGGQEYRENYFFPQAGRNFLAMVTFKF